MLLQGHEHGAIAGHLVLARVVAIPGLELELAIRGDVVVFELLVRRRCEEGAYAIDFGHVEVRGEVLRGLELRVDLLAELLDAERLHQDLDASLVDVVAAAIAVVHAQGRFDVRQQVLQRQELAKHLANDRRAAEAATDEQVKPIPPFASRCMCRPMSCTSEAGAIFR